MRLVAPVIAIALACSSVSVSGQTTTDPNGGRLAYVKKLIEESSAAKQVEASNDAEAKARREDARKLYRQAVAAKESGDTGKAEGLLTQAAKAMFEAVRKAGAKDVVAGKNERDYQDRLASVKALMEAHERISAEKGKQLANSELHDLVWGKVAAAEAARAQGDMVGARRLLDDAYVAAKVAIGSLRGGETLVRSLTFKTKEEEYRYELDRNDTHRMLVTMLLKEKMGDAQIAKMAQPFLDKAGQIRAEAEQQAAKGEYEKAVSTMDQSTREIVKAIRGAGIYIPG